MTDADDAVREARIKNACQICYDYGWHQECGPGCPCDCRLEFDARFDRAIEAKVAEARELYKKEGAAAIDFAIEAENEAICQMLEKAYVTGCSDDKAVRYQVAAIRARISKEEG